MDCTDNIFEQIAQDENAPTVVSGGEDTIHLSLWVKWDKHARDFQHELERLKRKARHYKLTEPEQLETFGFNYSIMPSALNPGKKGYTHFDYHLKDEGISIGLSFRPADNDTDNPNVRIEIGSLPLMLTNAETVWDNIMFRLEVMGAKILKHVISRIDLCVDLPNYDIQELCDAFMKRQYICQARNTELHGTLYDEPEDDFSEEPKIQRHDSGLRCTGFTIGKKYISMNAYEKMVETQHNEAKLMVLQTRRWGGCPDKAVRVEFRLRREALNGMFTYGKANGIKDMQTWFLCRAEVAEYLCTKWIRFVTSEYDKHNPDRMGEEYILPIWREITRKFQEWTGESSSHTYRGIPIPKLESEPLINQSIGCILSALLKSGRKFLYRTPRELITRALKWFIRRCQLLLDGRSDKDMKVLEYKFWQKYQYLQTALNKSAFLAHVQRIAA